MLDWQKDSGWPRVIQMIEFASIADSVEEIYGGCWCTKFSRGTFCGSSSLRIGDSRDVACARFIFLPV